MSELPFAVQYRRPTEGDIGFIVNGWLESYHDGCKWVRRVRFGRYKLPMRRQIHRLLSRGVCLLACDPESPEHLYGFAIGEKTGGRAVIHYVYVTQLRRKVGLAKALSAECLKALGELSWSEYTHDTHVGTIVAGKYSVDFNPFIAWSGDSDGGR